MAGAIAPSLSFSLSSSVLPRPPALSISHLATSLAMGKMACAASGGGEPAKEEAADDRPLCFKSFVSKKGCCGFMTTYTETEWEAAMALIAMRRSDPPAPPPERLVWTRKWRTSACHLVPSGEHPTVPLSSPERKSPVNDGIQMLLMAAALTPDVATREEKPKPQGDELEQAQPSVAEEPGEPSETKRRKTEVSATPSQPLGAALAAAPPPKKPQRKPAVPTGREHKCTTCMRVFLTGQALGGHKRKHWPGPAATARAPELHST